MKSFRASQAVQSAGTGARIIDFKFRFLPKVIFLAIHLDKPSLQFRTFRHSMNVSSNSCSLCHVSKFTRIPGILCHSPSNFLILKSLAHFSSMPLIFIKRRSSYFAFRASFELLNGASRPSLTDEQIIASPLVEIKNNPTHFRGYNECPRSSSFERFLSSRAIRVTNQVKGTSRSYSK